MPKKDLLRVLQAGGELVVHIKISDLNEEPELDVSTLRKAEVSRREPARRSFTQRGPKRLGGRPDTKGFRHRPLHRQQG